MEPKLHNYIKTWVSVRVHWRIVALSDRFTIASLKHFGQRQSWSASVTTPTCGNSVHQHDKASLLSTFSGVAPQ